MHREKFTKNADRSLVGGCDFSLRHYEEILRLGLEAGYTFVALKQFISTSVPPNRRIALLRHDIDTEPRRAIGFARVEEHHGVKSSFFVRVHADYNPFSYRVYEVLQEIVRMGHEVGLHYENIDFANLMGEDPVDVFMREKRILETVLDVKVHGVAAHRDFTGINNLDFWKSHDPAKLGVRYDAYQKNFLRDFSYVTDSLAVWRIQAPGQKEPRKGLCLCNYLSRRVPKLYVLTHPQYWYSRSYHLE